MKSSLAEFIGAFFLMLVIGLTTVPPSVGPFAPLAIGAIYIVVICALEGVSRGYFNPALSLALWLRGSLPARQLLPVFLAQVVAASMAGLLVVFLRGGVASPLLSLDPTKALLGEFLFTFILAFVVLGSGFATTSGGKYTHALAIGFALMASAYAITGLSGAALNPAVALGMCVTGILSWPTIWIFLVANVAGAALAAMVHRVIYPAPAGA